MYCVILYCCVVTERSIPARRCGGISSFSQAESRGGKVTLTRPVRFIADMKLTGRAK